MLEHLRTKITNMRNQQKNELLRTRNTIRGRNVTNMNASTLILGHKWEKAH